jgi:hypothetical protein
MNYVHCATNLLPFIYVQIVVVRKTKTESVEVMQTFFYINDICDARYKSLVCEHTHMTSQSSQSLSVGDGSEMPIKRD